jgi:Ca2+-transporting ATPase
VLSLTQLFHAFNMRHPTKSLLGLGLFSNPFLIGALMFGAALQISVISIPAFSSIFKVFPLNDRDWLFVAILAVIPIVCNELVKLIRRKRA